MRILKPGLEPGESETTCLCGCKFAPTRGDLRSRLVDKDFDGVTDTVKRVYVWCPSCKREVDVTGFRILEPHEEL